MKKTAPDPSKDAETPLMKQYNSIKAKYPDAILLFRVGDFYETFGEDAVKAAAILGIVLTRRANGSASFVELAGFPYHALDTYLPKLVRAGHRVAICDQLEDPKFAKKIVKRGVTELVTPGVSLNEKILDNRTNNFLAAVFIHDKNCGVSFADISTGEFYVAQGNRDYIDKLLQNFKPSEVLIQKNKRKDFTEFFGDKFYTFSLDEWLYNIEYATEHLTRHFGTASLKGFGIHELNHAVIAAGAALHYLSETRQGNLVNLKSLSRIEEDKFVWLDKFTIRNLELLHPGSESGASLCDVIDNTRTAMGSRLLKRWIMFPLKDKQPIEERSDIVHYFVHHEEAREKTVSSLKLTGDLERLISRIATGKANPRELLQLKRTLDIIPALRKSLLETGNPNLSIIADQMNPCSLINERISRELNPEAPLQVGKGPVMAGGVSGELDELRKIAFSGKEYLMQIQQREIEETGITSLKVGFNNVFGYFIEVTNTHKDKVPQAWVRKQTLTNAERYITDELKQYEEKILGAEDKILAIETKLFNDLVLAVGEYTEPVQLNASLLARLDVLLSFSQSAVSNNYVRPLISNSKAIEILGGRHPVIEKKLPDGEKYIPNDIYLDNDVQQILMITGPNMAGKSALLRQTALIVLMAQMGSFVPASSANIGLTDKIFTRVGASDNISSGESTFMVEMNETASILNNISDRSLILLDEIGRGTSTYDGISIAWAIAEFLHSHTEAKPKTLFATHYHELNEMADSMHRIKNFHVSVKEIGNKVIFLRKLAAGGTEHSFGIHVARMAGMPKKIIHRANEILSQLEKVHADPGNSGKPKKEKDEIQLSIFQLDDPVLEQVREQILGIDINTLTPVEALMKLNEIKSILGGK